MKLGLIFSAVLSMTALATLGTGCAANSGENETASGDAQTKPQMSICFSGRSFGSDPYSSGGNPEMASLCKALPNLVTDKSGPDAAYPFFRWDSDVNHALDVLVAALDTNHDGWVTNTDVEYDLNVVGFSWGGFNAHDLIAMIQTDRRFSPSRHGVARYFALDPFRTYDLVLPMKELDVPSNVGTMYEFRHTVAPKDDCSRIAWGLVGPFTGRNPVCTGSTVCFDYDYSLQASTANVDHCGVPGASTHAVLEVVNGQAITGTPPQHKVARD